MTRLEQLMVILIEECAEVQQATTKALRFGLYETHNGLAINVLRLREEVNDLLAVLEMLEADGIYLSADSILIQEKKDKVEKYLLYSAKCRMMY